MDQVECISMWEPSLVNVWLRLRNGILQLREGVSYMGSIGTRVRLGYRLTKTERVRPRIESSDRHERIVDSRDVLGIHGPERDGIGFGISDHYVTGKDNHVTGNDNHDTG